MSLPPQPLPPVPDDTARIARAAFRRGNPYVLLRDQLGAVFATPTSPTSIPSCGQPGLRAVAARPRHAHAVPRGLERPPSGRGRPGPDRLEIPARPRPGRPRLRLLRPVRVPGQAAPAWGHRAPARSPAGRSPRGRAAQGPRPAAHRQHARARRGARPEPPGAAGRDLAGGAERHRQGGARTGCAPQRPPTGTSATTAGSRTCACPMPAPSATPTWSRWARTASSCSTRWTGRRRPRAPGTCRRSPCCAACGRGTSSGPGQDRGRQYGRRPGRRRAAAAGAGPRPRRPCRVALRRRGPLPLQGRHELDRLHGPPHRDLRRGLASPGGACRHDAGQRARGDAHRADPRRAGRQGSGPVRAPGRRGLRQRRAPRRGPRAARHRPDRAGAAGPELAEAGGGCRPRHRLRGGLGAPARALPRGPREHELGRVPGQGVRSAPTSGWASARPIAGPARRSRVAPGPRAGGSACTRARSTRRSPPPGCGRRAGRAAGSTPSARVSRARSRRACAPSACAGRATAGWPRRACKTWPPPRPSTSTASRHGSPDVRSHLRVPRASPRSRHSGRLRQRYPSGWVAAPSDPAAWRHAVRSSVA